MTDRADMQQTQQDLAALIGSRICHDLISPIGAINNGIELLGMTTKTSGPELSLISESVENASVRIRFFRLAFGAASQERMKTAEIQNIFRDLTRNSKLTVDYAPREDATRADVRLALLAQQCVESAMPYGGAITITETDTEWQITGRSEKFKADPDLWALLTDPVQSDSVLPAHVHFPLLANHALSEGRSLAADCGATEISIRFTR